VIPSVRIWNFGLPSAERYFLSSQNIDNTVKLAIHLW
jgi:hypothetical protein